MKKISISILLMLIAITSFGQGKFYKSYEFVKDSVFEQKEGFFIYFETGVASKKKGTILIPKSYQNIAIENEYLICQKVDTTDYSTTYDIYNWSKKEIKPFKQNIAFYKDFPLEIFHSEIKEDFKLRHCVDSAYYTMTTPTGMGLYILDIFNYSYRYTEVFDPTHDFVAAIGVYDHKVVGIKNGEIIIKRLIDNELPFTSYHFSAKKSIYFKMDYERFDAETFYIDGTAYYPQTDPATEDEYYNAIEKTAKNPRTDFYGLDGIEVINDSLIYIQGFFIEDEYYVIDDDGYELVDDFGEPTYFQPPGEFSSGIFHLEKQEWAIDRNKSFIMKTYLGFLEETAAYSEEEKDHSFSYSFKNNNGSYKFENISYEALMMLEDANQYITPKYKVDSITPFMYVSKVWSNGQYHFCEKAAQGFYSLLPNHKEYEASNLPFINEVSLKYAIEKEAIQFYTDDTVISFPLNRNVLLFETSETSDSYFDKLFLQTNNQLFDISDFSNKQVKQLEIQILDSLLKKDHSVIIKSNGDSILTFTNYYDDLIYDVEFGEPISDENGNLYEQGDAFSGVYNYKSKIWIAEPKYKLAFRIDDNYLLWFPKELSIEYDYDGLHQKVTIIAEEYFTIIDTQGKTIETVKKVMDLPISYLSKIDKKELALLELNDFETMRIRYGLVSYIEDEFLGGDGVFYGKAEDNKWGLFQTFSRNEIIPAKYDSIEHIGWDSPFTIVWNNGKAGVYIDLFGKALKSIPCWYENAKRGYSDGYYYLAVQKDGKWGYVDWNNGKELTGFIYNSIEELPSASDYPSEFYK